MKLPSSFHFQQGVFHSQKTNLVLEELHLDSHPEHHDRIKRGVEESDNDGLIMIYESVASGGDCGLNKFNKARMKVSPKKMSSFKLDDLKVKAEDKDKDDFNNNSDILFIDEASETEEDLNTIYQK